MYQITMHITNGDKNSWTATQYKWLSNNRLEFVDSRTGKPVQINSPCFPIVIAEMEAPKPSR